MAKRALIHGTRVCEIKNPGEEFPVAPELRWVDCADDVTTQHTYTGGVFTPPPPLAPPPSVDANALLKIKIDAALADLTVPLTVRDVFTEWRKKL